MSNIYNIDIRRKDIGLDRCYFIGTNKNIKLISEFVSTEYKEFMKYKGYDYNSFSSVGLYDKSNQFTNLILYQHSIDVYLITLNEQKTLTLSTAKKLFSKHLYVLENYVNNKTGFIKDFYIYKYDNILKIIDIKNNNIYIIN